MNNQTLELLRSLVVTLKSLIPVVAIVGIVAQIQNMCHYDDKQKPYQNNIAILFVVDVMLALFSFIQAIIQVPLGEYSPEQFINTLIFLTLAFRELQKAINIHNNIYNNNRNDTNNDSSNN